MSPVQQRFSTLGAHLALLVWGGGRSDRAAGPAGDGGGGGGSHHNQHSLDIYSSVKPPEDAASCAQPGLPCSWQD